MVAIIGFIIIIIDMIAIKLYDKEIRQDKFKKVLVTYSWLFGVVLFLIGIVMLILGAFV